MNKFVKVSLIATAFAFVVGCATQEKPSVQQDTISNSHQLVKKNMHPSQKCKGKKCVGKLGETSYTGDTTK